MHFSNKKPLRYAYFPGCASKQAVGEYDATVRLVCEKLGIELVEIPEFSCCGAGVVREVDKEFNEVLNARNFALSEAKKLDIMTICSTCVINLRKDLIGLQEDPEKLTEANKKLKRMQMKCDAKLDVKHFLWALTEDYGLENLKAKVKVPLTGIKIATYYGCHIARPSKYVSPHQDSDNPKNFEALIKALGAIPVDLPEKLDCCGFHSVLMNKKASGKMSGKYLSSAKDSGADVIVTNCPFCHMQMDLYQGNSEKAIGRKLDMPIMHMSQLICLALGIPLSEIGAERHIVELPEKILKKFA
jgi:succinate dehydrogenase cytochrome b subunit